MNKCTRIEAAATEGAMLASKNLIERLADGDAAAGGVDQDGVAHTTFADLVPEGQRAELPGARRGTSSPCVPW